MSRKREPPRPLSLEQALGQQIVVSFEGTDEPPPQVLQMLAEQRISLEAVLQLPSDTKRDLPFVITVEPTYEHAVREAVQKMSHLEFLREPPLALPMEPPL